MPKSVLSISQREKVTDLLCLTKSIYSSVIGGPVTSSMESVGMFCTGGERFFNPTLAGGWAHPNPPIWVGNVTQICLSNTQTLQSGGQSHPDMPK
eukprot:scaffold80429_cov66-Attheya_sp.AAC.1